MYDDDARHKRQNERTGTCIFIFRVACMLEEVSRRFFAETSPTAQTKQIAFRRLFPDWHTCSLIVSTPRRSSSQAERERQRENEIRAFRDFSLNLSSTPLPSTLGGQGGDDHDDGNFPRGPPKRAEYKTGVGVNLDALRDPTVSYGFI